MGLYSWRERALIAWVAPRGIVAAAVSSLFALRLQDAGYAEAPLLVAYTFPISPQLWCWRSFTASTPPSLLGLVEAEPRGDTDSGRNPAARVIGKALLRGVSGEVRHHLVGDPGGAQWHGRTAYHGDPVSAHADRQRQLEAIGRLLPCRAARR